MTSVVRFLTGNSGRTVVCLGNSLGTQYLSCRPCNEFAWHSVCDRRAFVAALLATTAGCNGLGIAYNDSSTSTTNGSPATIGTEQQVAGTDVTIESLVVRDAVFQYPFPDEVTVASTTDRRWVIVEVLVEQAAIRPSTIRLAIEDRSYSFGTAGLTRPALPWDSIGDPYAHGTQARGWLATKVPAPLSPAGRPTISAEGSDWTLGQSVRSRLTAPDPSYQLAALTVPDSIQRGDPIPVSYTVENRSSTPGVFHGIIDVTGESDAVGPGMKTTTEVGAGDQALTTVVIDSTDYQSDTGSVALELRGQVDSKQRSVALTDD